MTPLLSAGLALALAGPAPGLPPGVYRLGSVSATPFGVRDQLLDTLAVGVPGARRATARVRGAAVRLAWGVGGAACDFEGVIDPATPGEVLGSFTQGGRGLTRARLTRTDPARPPPARFEFGPPAPDLAGLPEAAPWWPHANELAGRWQLNESLLPQEMRTYPPPAWVASHLNGPRDPGRAEAEARAERLLAHPRPEVRAAGALSLLAPDPAADGRAGFGWSGPRWAKQSGRRASELARIYLESEAKFGARQLRAARWNARQLLLRVPACETAALALSLAIRADLPAGAPAPERLRALEAVAECEYRAGLPGEARAEVAAVWGEILTARAARFAAELRPLAAAPVVGRPADAANRAAVVEVFARDADPLGPALDAALTALVESDPARQVLVLYSPDAEVRDPNPSPTVPTAPGERLAYYRRLGPEPFADWRPAPGGVLAYPEPGLYVNGARAADPWSKRGAADPPTSPAAALRALGRALAPQLGRATSITLSGEAELDADDLTLEVRLGGIGPGAGQTARLRLALVEERAALVVSPEEVRFVPCRVRGWLGTTGGVPLEQLDAGRHTASYSRAALERAAGAPLPGPAWRPGHPVPAIDWGQARVVALVQDDAAGEILQAVPLPTRRR